MTAPQIKPDKPRRNPAVNSGEMHLTYTPHASEHDLIYGYAYAVLLNGHGADPWLSRPLSEWIETTEKELRYRGLFKKAKLAYRTLLKQHREDASRNRRQGPT